MRKTLLAFGGVILMGITGAVSGVAQATAGSGLPTVPTTKVLAIGRLTAPVGGAAVRPMMGAEVRATVKLYLGGKIDQWYVRQDQSGVVFLMNVTTVEEAHALLEALPLGVAKLMEFDLIPLGPLTPLSVLLAPSSVAAPAPAK